MDIKLELIVLLLIQLIAGNSFAHFEIRTPAIRKIFKWLIYGCTNNHPGIVLQDEKESVIKN